MISERERERERHFRHFLDDVESPKCALRSSLPGAYNEISFSLLKPSSIGELNWRQPINDRL